MTGSSILFLVLFCTVGLVQGAFLLGTWDDSTNKVNSTSGVSCYVKYDANGFNIGVYLDTPLAENETVFVFFNVDNSTNTEEGSNYYDSNGLTLPFQVDFVAFVSGSNASQVIWQSYPSWDNVSVSHIPFSNSTTLELSINDTRFVSGDPSFDFITVVKSYFNGPQLQFAWLAPSIPDQYFFGFFDTNLVPPSSPTFISSFPFVFKEPGNWTVSTNWMYQNIPILNNYEYLQNVFLTESCFYDRYDPQTVAHLYLSSNVQFDLQNLGIVIGKGQISCLTFETNSSIINANPLTLKPPLQITAPEGYIITGSITVADPGEAGNNIMGISPNISLVINGTLTVTDDSRIEVPVTYNGNSALVFESSPSYSGIRDGVTNEWIMMPNDTTTVNSSIPYSVTIKRMKIQLFPTAGYGWKVTNALSLNSGTLSIAAEGVLWVGGVLSLDQSSQLYTNSTVYVSSITGDGRIFCSGVSVFQKNTGVYQPYPPLSVVLDGIGISEQVTLNGSLYLQVDNTYWNDIQWWKDSVIISNDSFLEIDQLGQYHASATNVATGCNSYFYFSVVSSPSPTASPSPGGSSNKPKSGNGAVVGIAAGSAGAAVLVGAIIGVVIWKRKKATSAKKQAEEDLVGEPPQSTDYEEMGETKPSNQDQDKRASKIKSNEIDYKEITIGNELGRGAFGVVYKAKWRNTDVVVKQMDSNKQDEHSMKQFLKETTNVQNVRSHPNVCAVFGVCTDPGYPACIVMEYVGGGSLDHLLYHGKIKVDGKLAVEFGKNIAGGMSHLHQENVLHCDLAARNLLVSQQDGKYILKISDFGLSKVTESDSYNASTSSTFPIRWTPPEALRGGKITRAFDVWSFGVVMWEIIECKQPYPAMSNTEVINQVCDHGYRLPKPQRIPIPDELYQLMLKCWEVDPDERPTFNAIYEELDRIYQQYYGEVEKKESGQKVESTRQQQSLSGNYGNKIAQPDHYENAAPTTTTAFYGNES